MNHGNMTWDAQYELGIEDIDFQHHLFLNLINRLSDEIINCADADYRLSLISELNAYARFHFISEENMMRRENYPRLAEHRKQHRDLIDQLSAKQNLLVIRDSAKEADALIGFLVDWFVNHTTCEDRLFADYLHAKTQ